MQKNEPFIYIKKEITNLGEFFDRFEELVKDKSNDETTYDTLIQETEEMINEIKDSDYVEGLRKYKMPKEQISSLSLWLIYL